MHSDTAGMAFTFGAPATRDAPREDAPVAPFSFGAPAPSHAVGGFNFGTRNENGSLSGQQETLHGQGFNSSSSDRAMRTYPIPCKDFAEGSCKNGDKCYFSHASVSGRGHFHQGLGQGESRVKFQRIVIPTDSRTEGNCGRQDTTSDAAGRAFTFGAPATPREDAPAADRAPAVWSGFSFGAPPSHAVRGSVAQQQSAPTFCFGAMNNDTAPSQNQGFGGSFLLDERFQYQGLNSSSMSGAPVNTSVMYAYHVPCKDFAQGSCKNGDQCYFAHASGSGSGRFNQGPGEGEPPVKFQRIVLPTDSSTEGNCGRQTHQVVPPRRRAREDTRRGRRAE